MRPTSILFMLFLIGAGSGMWVYGKLRLAREEVLRLQGDLERLTRSMEVRDRLLTVDAHIIEHGHYEQALDSLHALRGIDGGMDQVLEDRIGMLHSILKAGDVNTRSTDPQELLLLRYQRSLEELQAERNMLADRSARQLDSLLLKIEEQRIDLDRKQRELARREQVQVLAFTSPKGQKINYLGEVKDGKANGGGVGLWTTGSVYRGQWKNNLRHGEGTFEWADGERYEGIYVEGAREGFGRYFWPSGDRYEGQWKGDRRNGQGTLYDMDGNVRYKGLWKDDKPVE